jgi:acyl-CoA synthetase (NDP forming)
MEIQGKLKSCLGKGGIGVGLSNPVDLSDQGWDIFRHCTKIILDYDGIDLLIAHLHVGVYVTNQISSLLGIVKQVVIAHKESNKPKPIAVVVGSAISTESWHVALGCEQECRENNLPIYHSVNNAAKAIVRFLDYHEHRSVKGQS